VKSGTNIGRRSFIVGAASATGVAGLVSLSHILGHRDDNSLATQDSAVWVTTTQNSPWQMRPLHFTASRWNPTSLEVLLDRTFQTMEGFGGCFNELGWTSLQVLSSSAQDTVFKELFAPGHGGNLSICRTPVAANDFSRSWYSYDESPGDFDLTHFTIANDLETLVPFIKKAQSYNPSLRVWASPWSPPSWMKRNNFYAEAPPSPDLPLNGIQPGQVGSEGSDMFIQEDRYFAAYANYFGRFVDAYRKVSIDVRMVMPQNEFNSAQPFPSCTWTPQGLARFIEHLGPAMTERGVDIFFGTLERANASLLDAFFKSSEQVSRYIKGVGIQWAGKDALPGIHENYPNLSVYQSEQECGDGRNDWKHCIHCWDLMKSYLRNGASAYMYWNLSLPLDGKSHWGWRQNSLVSVDTSTRTYKFNHEYYLLKHVSHFVQPGAHRVDVQGILTDALAFVNPDGSVAVILRNSAPFGRPVTMVLGRRRIEAWMEPNSFNTVLLRPEHRGNPE